MSQDQYPRLIPLEHLCQLLPASQRGDTSAPNINTNSTRPLADSVKPYFTLPLPILTVLSATLGDPAAPRTTTPEFIAFCHYNINPYLADVLRVPEISAVELQHLSAQVTLGIRHWLSKPAIARSNPSPNDSPNDTRQASRQSCSTTAAERCLTRDGHKCSITNQREVIEAAHIFPLSTFSSCAGNNNNSNRSTPPFLKLLELFAGPHIMCNVSDYLGLAHNEATTIDSPSRSSRTTLKINRLQNLITLGASLHGYFDGGRCLLEPVGDPIAIFDSDLDPTSVASAQPPTLISYDVRFSWLPRHRPPSISPGWDQTSIVQAEPIESLQYRESEDPVLRRVGFLRALDTENVLSEPTFERLQTGTLIRLQTPDPVKYPLLHPDLLRLHAALSRVVRCSGVAVGHINCSGFDEDSDLEDGISATSTPETHERDTDEQESVHCPLQLPLQQLTGLPSSSASINMATITTGAGIPKSYGQIPALSRERNNNSQSHRHRAQSLSYGTHPGSELPQNEGYKTR